MKADFFKKEKISDTLPYASISSADTAKEIQDGKGRISLSGVQAKLSAVSDNGLLRLVKEGERGRYIIKPIPTGYHLLERDFLPYNECLCMNMAHDLYDIETAECGICKWQDGSVAYITKRFDVNADGTKRSMEDFAALAGLTKANGGIDYKYSNLSYEECGDIIRKYTAAPSVEILKFFRVVVFNFLICNDDAHLKNFSLIEKASGDFGLSPAYDLINTSIHLYEPRIFALDKGLFKEGMHMTDTHTVDGSDFKEFGRRIGLPTRLVERELKKFRAPNKAFDEMVNDMITSNTIRESFVSSFKYRQVMLSE